MDPNNRPVNAIVLTWGKTLVLAAAVVLGFVALGLLLRTGWPSGPGPQNPAAFVAAHPKAERYRIVSVNDEGGLREAGVEKGTLVILDTATGVEWTAPVTALTIKGNR